MTAGQSRVTIYAKSTVVSTSPVIPGKTYPLSVLDHAMSKHSIHLVFYYRPGPTLTRDRLRASLSEVLSHYPAVTGRLSREGVDGKWVVKCNDAGIRMLHARVKGVTLTEWMETATADEEKGLANWEPMAKEVSLWSPFCVQITEFEDGGFAIGLSCTHLHTDPTCAILFMKAWGDLHRRACIINPPFCHPPALLPRADPNTSTRSTEFLVLKSKLSPNTTAKGLLHMSSATFCFSGQAVKSCLDSLHKTSPDATPFDALASLFWLSIARTKSEQAGPSALTICIDFRKLMHAPLPHGFYGNTLHFSRIEVDDGLGWGHVANEINHHVAGIEEEEYWSMIDWFGSDGRESRSFQMYGPEITCVKLDHVFAYGVTFEKDGGKPAHVSLNIGGAEGDGVLIVMPSTEEGGRTVAVTLPEEVMERVCKDDVILGHGPTVVFRDLV